MFLTEAEDTSLRTPEPGVWYDGPYAVPSAPHAEGSRQLCLHPTSHGDEGGANAPATLSFVSLLHNFSNEGSVHLIHFIPTTFN